MLANIQRMAGKSVNSNCLFSSMYSKFNDFVAKENKDASWHVFSTRAKRGPFDYAVYFHDGENSEAFMEYDFFWVNYLADLDEAAERGAQWVETGGY